MLISYFQIRRLQYVTDCPSSMHYSQLSLSDTLRSIINTKNPIRQFWSFSIESLSSLIQCTIFCRLSYKSSNLLMCTVGGTVFIYISVRCPNQTSTSVTYVFEMESRWKWLYLGQTKEGKLHVANLESVLVV